jgi:hypothetical protein
VNWKSVYDFVLAAAFLLAAHKIMVAAMEGRKQIRVFRFFGVGLAFAWSIFFVAHGIDVAHEIIANNVWDVAVRALMSTVAAMFLVWGFLFNERNWPR